MKPFTINTIPRLILSYLGTILIISLVTVLLKVVEKALEIQIIALLYLLPVLICTVFWGLTSGILAGLLSFLAFNYFFIQPYFTLQVHKTQDLITLIVFLIVAVVLSQFVGQAREAVRLAKKREWEATRMYELISALAGLTDIQSIMHTLADQIISTFQFDQVKILVNSSSSKGSNLTYLIPAEVEIIEPFELSVPMYTARNMEGEIQLWFDQNNLSVEETRLMAAFGNQGALAIERIRLTESENVARVLKESDRIKTSLLNSVSHELRSPLAAIKASASSLRSGAVDWDTPARAELLATVEEETDQLNLLVGNLLDMSRIEAGALEPKIQWNSIEEIIKSEAAKMRGQLTHYRVQYQFENDLPLLPTDFVMMGQVFTNLFSNSVKYAPIDTPIRINARLVEKHVIITFINQSSPVPEEHLEHIFDKFHRVTQADRVTGTGLGLSICKGIVEAHGGKIWAENQKEGFAFVIRLPITLDGSLPNIPKDELDG
jgi:two-component system, OmpR family, sensor histidine kinase KdpD